MNAALSITEDEITTSYKEWETYPLYVFSLEFIVKLKDKTIGEEDDTFIWQMIRKQIAQI